jgi:hypothetical protein
VIVLADFSQTYGRQRFPFAGVEHRLNASSELAVFWKTYIDRSSFSFTVQHQNFAPFDQP